MARAMTRGWLRVAVVAVALAALADGGPLGAQGRRAHNQLASGIEMYRRGEYELADTAFQQALVGQEDLSATERQELNNRIQLNSTALQSRRDGQEQLRQADAAFRAGRSPEAAELLKDVLNNQFLNSADKQKAQQLNEQMRPRAAAPTQATPSTGATPLLRARAKLEQARKLLAKGDYAAAESLANEADGLGATYMPGEDTPSKVRADVAKARASAKAAKPDAKAVATKLDAKNTPAKPEVKDAKAMLAAGRAALEKGDVNQAEQLAHDAEKADTGWMPHMFGDSPAKLLKDVQTARAKLATPKPGTAPTTVVTGPNSPRSPTTPNTKPDAMTAAPSTAKPKDNAAVATGPGAAKPSEASNATKDTAPKKDGSTFALFPWFNKKDEPAKPTDDKAMASGPKPGDSLPPAKPKDGMANATGPKPGDSLPPSKPKETASIPKMPAPTAADNEGARDLIKQGRKALQDNQVAKAKDCAEQAARKKPTFEWWEDNPEKLMTDVRRAEAKSSAPAAVVQAGVKPDDKAKPAETPAGDPRQQLQQARSLFSQGKLDEAKALAQKANVNPGAKWGLFEDNPEKLFVDIQKERVKRDKDESVKLLAEARKAYEQNKFEEAETKAYKASRMHGAYSVWDLGDRPDRLLGEIQTAKVKGRKTTLPDAPPVAVVKNDPKIKPETPPVSGSKPTDAAPAPQWPAESPAAVVRQKPATPPAAVAQQPSTPPTFAPLTPIVRQPDAPPAQVVEQPYTPPTFAPPTPIVRQPDTPPAQVVEQPPVFTPPTQVVAVPAVDPNKAKAKAWMAEVRKLQAAGKLVEARTTALQCQKLGVAFDPEEDRPETALLQLAALADKRIESLMQEATDYTVTGQGDPARVKKAEDDLALAKQLAQGFGLDVQPIDSKAQWVKSQAGAVVQMPNPAAVAPAVNPAKQRGLDLLAKSRLELKSGQMLTARRLAEEAYSGPYEVQPEASAMLRSIDAEEFNQQVLEAEKTFAAGHKAFLSKDYRQARGIFENMDTRLLPPGKKAMLKNIMIAPEMQASSVSSKPSMVKGGNTAPGNETPVVQVKNNADATASTNVGYAKEVADMQDIEFQRLREESRRVQVHATETFPSAPDKAIESLTEYRDRLADSGLDQDRLILLKRPIDARVQQFTTLKAQKTFASLSNDKNKAFTARKAQEAETESMKQSEVKDLVKQYNALRKEGKYHEAQLAAAKGQELDPDNPIFPVMIYTARILENQADSTGGKKRREDIFTKGLNEAEDPGPTMSDNHPVAFDKDFQLRTKDRSMWISQTLGHKSDKEREIERRLSQPVNLEFRDIPLYRAVDDLRELTGVNIIIDRAALEEADIKLDRPLTEKLDGVAMKSALNILLAQLHLTYVIRDEVLQITTPKHAQGKLVQRTFPVADLIIPVDNHVLPGNSNLLTALGQPNADTGHTSATIRDPRGGLRDGVDVTSMANTVSGGSSNSPSAPGNPVANTRQPGQLRTMEDLLIKLITSTIQPNSWSEVGGPGTIEYFPLGMALVINQVPDVQEQVQDLLDALRKLQDLEVSVEVRMITLSEAFFERVGLDFNLNVNPKVSKGFNTQIVTQQFQPLNQVNAIGNVNQIIGLTPAGTATSDLNIPIHSSSFQYAIPPFGGYPGIPGADGGLSLGLAFLSDIQVFLFMEAAQGDRRFNVMQAPKLTLFNGQTSTIQIQDFQFFVTNVQVVQNAGQTTFVPQNQPIPLGVNLAVQAVVSADRRFVRLNLAPTLTNLASATVPLFPITTFITPVFEGGAQGQPIPFTQFIQQPTFTTVTVQTSVSVPDGGTVLLGGLKLLNEGRNEFGPPVLSKIPYVSRLFRNVGYGRDTSSLLLMVTPRIIINTEEEVLQTGVGELPRPQQ